LLDFLKKFTNKGSNNEWNAVDICSNCLL
jgi:hypothetical protein